jgi:hypothetical protein
MDCLTCTERRQAPLSASICIYLQCFECPGLASRLHINTMIDYYRDHFMTRRRRITTILLITFLAITVGTVAVKADPACRRLVREYREKRVRNRVSKETAARWAEWNKTHPNFHPHARPKYKIVPEEVVKQVEFACEVPQTPSRVTALLPPTVPEFKFDPVAVVLPPPELPPVTQVAQNNGPTPPFLPPYNGGLPPGLSQVPEPSSLVMLLSGCFALGAVALYQKRKSPKAHAC